MVGHTRVLTRPAPGSRLRVSWLAGAVASALLAAAVLSNPMAGLWAKALVDPFFHSTSAGAALVVLLFVAAVCLRMAWAPTAVLATPSRWLVALPAAVLVGHASNLLSHLWLMHRFELPWTAAIHHWSGDSNTYSWLFHSHTGKAGLDLLFAGVLNRWAPTYDIGRALGATLPPAVGVLSAACLLVGLSATLKLWPLVVQRWGHAAGWLFGFCALSCVKTAADGGPLTYRFVPAAAVLACVLARLWNCGRPTHARLVLGLATCAAAYGVLWWALSPEPGASALTGLVVTLAILGGLGMAAAQAAAPSRALRLRAGTGLCAAVVLASVAASLLGTPVALLMPLDDTLQATVCDKLGCRTQPTAGRSAFEVYQAAGDDALKPNHTFIAPADAATAGHSSMLVVVRALRTVPVSAPTVEGVAGVTGLTGVRARPVRQVGGTANVLVELSGAGLPAVFGTAAHAFGNRNYHVFLHRAAATLRGQGLADFVLSPVRDPSDGQAFGFD